MKIIKFYIVGFVFLLTNQAMAIGVGDYVSYDQDEKGESQDYGTVVKVSPGDELTIRPHRNQGDFKIAGDQVRLIKDAASLAAAQPKAGEYTINLMWVNGKDVLGNYVFPDAALKTNLAKVAGWSQKNPDALTVVWYDSASLKPDAVEKTQEALVKDFPAQAPHIVFKDLRVFPEVVANPDAFSSKIPVYFRVDLFRVVAAYNVLNEATAQGKRHYFAYADIDVTPLSKDELFDAPTQMDLDTFGIVMAHGGGFGLFDFENSFQVWSNNKPNLLLAAKAAIIDFNILRAKQTLEGEYQIKNLDQMVYNSYIPMFYAFYQLENWGVTKGQSGDPIELNDFGGSGAEEVFDHRNNFSLTFKSKNPLVTYSKEFFGYNGKLSKREKLYVPGKIIEAPPSRFSGAAPTKFNPNKITERNFKEKLAEALTIRPFNNFLLLVAITNNYMDSAIKIINELSTEELEDAVINDTAEGGRSDTPLKAALKADREEIYRLLSEKLGDRPAFIEKVQEANEDF